MGYVTRPHGFTVAASPSAACALPLSQMCSAQALPFAALRLCCCGFAIAAHALLSQRMSCARVLPLVCVLCPQGFTLGAALPSLLVLHRRGELLALALHCQLVFYALAALLLLLVHCTRALLSRPMACTHALP